MSSPSEGVWAACRRGVMKIVMVTLSEETARWVRARAAEQNRERVELAGGADRADAARRRPLRDHDDERAGEKPRRMEWIDGRRPTRKELHDRAGSR